MKYELASYIISQRYSGAPNLDIMIRAEMEIAQTHAELDPIKPWFLVKQVDNFQVTTSGYALVPPDFLQEWSEDDAMSVWLKMAEGSDTLTPISKRNLSQIYSNDSNYPIAYAVVGDRMEFRPKPTRTLTGRFIYYAKDAPVQENAENQWLKHAPGMLVGPAGAAIGQFLGEEAQKIKWFNDLYAQTRGLLQNQTVARREANRVVLFGSGE